MTAPQLARILVLVSSPLDAAINLGDDLACLREAVADLPCAAHFDVHVAEAERVGDLLARADRPRYDVLHYLGHGDLLQNGVGVLWFEDRHGRARAMRDLNLITTLQPLGRPEFALAVVSACHSAAVAPALHALGIRHIVAVEADQSVYKVAAVAFYRRFYRALLSGASVAEAFAAGRTAVFNAPELGARAAAEAAKFTLLPANAPHEEMPFAGLPEGGVTLDNLPALTAYPFDQQPIEFVGRAADMLGLIETLNDTRAAVVLGPSGIGKTELAKQTARWLAARRRVRHVGFVALVNVHSADQARAAMAQALGLEAKEVSDDGALARLCPPGALLIVDEAEGVIQADGLRFRNLLNALAQAPARPRLIVTSQTDPNTPHVRPLQVRRLPDEAAFRLFARTAGLTPAQLARIPPNDLQEVLEFVDRVPRAIELVARAWQRQRGSDPNNVDLRPLLDDLRERHDQVMRDPDYPDAVKSVTVGIQLAYDRLRAEDAEAAALYAYLGLFPGGVPKAALPALFGLQAAAQADAIQKHGLVEMPFSHFPAPLHDLLYLPAPFAAFARRRLPANARDALGARALEWYYDTGWVGALDAALSAGGAATGAFIARYAAERPSIEAWLDWGYAHESGTDNRSRAARLTAQLDNLYIITDTLVAPETRARLERALACARRCADRQGEANTLRVLGDLKQRRIDDLAGARADYDAALDIYRAIGARRGEANTLRALGDLKRRIDDLAGARADCDAALDIYRAIGDRLGEAYTLRSLGDLKRRIDDLAGARADYAAALTLFRAIGDRLGEANTLQSLGDLKLRRDDLAGARADYDAALDIYRAIGARLGEAYTLWGLGDLKRRIDDLAGARADYDAALTLFRAIGDRLGEAYTLWGLGDLKRRIDDLAGARADYDAALTLFRVIGDRLGEAYTLWGLGDLKRRIADLAGARADYAAALTLFRAIGDRLGEANTLWGLGDLKQGIADLAGARADYAAALDIYRAIGDRLGEANTLWGLGDLKQGIADLAGARTDYDAALDIYRAIGDRRGEANTLRSLGDLKQRLDDLAGARADYDAALDIYRAIGDRRGEAYTLRSLGDLKRRIDDLAGARADYAAALTLFRAIGDRRGEAYTLWGLGDLKLRRDDLAGARADYDAALTLFRAIGDRRGEAYTLLGFGDERLAAGDPEAALAHYAAAQSIFERLDDRYSQSLSLIRIGLAERALGRDADAMAHLAMAARLADAIQDHRLHSTALELLAEICETVKDWRMLDDPLATLIAAHPEDAELRKRRGDARYAQKRYAEALDDLQVAVSLDPENVWAWNSLGNTYESLKRYEEALAAYTRAIALAADEALIYRNRADLLLRLGRDAAAEADVARAVALAPDHPYTRARQGQLALARGRCAEAAAHLEAALAAQPDDAQWQALLALARLGLGEADRAREMLAAALPRMDDEDRETARLWLERIAPLCPAESVAAMRALLSAPSASGAA
jgi:tetratricopeptide (TPR) repeat protein